VNSTSSNVIYLFPQSTAAKKSAHADRSFDDAGRRLARSLPEVTRSRDPVEQAVENQEPNLYSAVQVEKFLGIPVGRLRYWSRKGLVVPSGRCGRLRYYTFQDIVAAKAASSLMDSGLAARHIARALRALRRRLPERTAPLAELRLAGEGKNVVVNDEDHRFEAESGQIVLNFDLDELQRQVVELIHPGHRPESAQRQAAFDAYLEGCRLEVQPESLGEAEHSYRRALDIDPHLACAYTNLGNIRYLVGAVDDARALYEKAIELEPEQPEALYNLAFLSSEEGDTGRAIELFEQTLSLDPDFADAHFNLAMALIESGRTRQARRHLTTYLALEPSGPLSELAREELH
jgi:Flp pilus assembly protein TadD